MPVPSAMRVLLLLLMIPAGASAQAMQGASPDGRLFGHLPYPELATDELASAPPGFAAGQPCRLRAVVLPDVVRLLAAADAAGLGGQLRGLSCFRSIARQQSVFCRRGRACADAERRAAEVGPPGHSEHATGYAIDFVARPAIGCGDVDPCFAATPAGRWLLANGARFGFELSFPQANAQGVTWEPWHWRWVGATQEEPGAGQARAMFARARTDYPAAPAAIGFALRFASQSPPPVTTGADPVTR